MCCCLFCFVFPGVLISFRFGSINAIKKAGTWLGGMLKQTATLSYYRSLIKAAQSNRDPERNLRIIAALRNTVVSVYHSSVVLISNLVNYKYIHEFTKFDLERKKYISPRMSNIL